jgi:hypothetical protein
MTRKHARGAAARSRSWLVLLAGALLLGLLGLAACGGSYASIPNPIPTRSVSGTANSATGGTATPAATGTVEVTGQNSYAYLYSRVDYPLQIPVGANDTVTLTLSPQAMILSTGAHPGGSVTTVGAPIPLPTDLQDYDDIAAEAVAQGTTASAPIAWQLTSAPRQSLLTADHQYAATVAFQWRVQAAAAGQNTAKIVLSLYYIYLDGSQQAGTIEVTSAPIPIVAVQPTPVNSTLLPFKLPIAGLSGLAGLIAFIRFIWEIFTRIDDTMGSARDAAHVAGAVRSRVAAGPQVKQGRRRPRQG